MNWTPTPVLVISPFVFGTRRKRNDIFIVQPAASLCGYVRRFFFFFYYNDNIIVVIFVRSLLHSARAGLDFSRQPPADGRKSLFHYRVRNNIIILSLLLLRCTTCRHRHVFRTGRTRHDRRRGSRGRFCKSRTRIKKKILRVLSFYFLYRVLESTFG